MPLQIDIYVREDSQTALILVDREALGRVWQRNGRQAIAYQLRSVCGNVTCSELRGRLFAQAIDVAGYQTPRQCGGSMFGRT